MALTQTVLKRSGTGFRYAPKRLRLHTNSQDNIQIEMSRRAGGAASLFGSAMRLTRNRKRFDDFNMCGLAALNRARTQVPKLGPVDIPSHLSQSFGLKT